MKFNFSLADVKRLIKWLEQKLTHNDQEQNELSLGKRVGSEDEYVLGLNFIDENNDSYHSLYWQSGLSIPYSECCVVYTYNTTKSFIDRVAFCCTEDIVRRMYTTLRHSKGLRYKSDIIEAFFLNKPALKLEYKGYSTTAHINKIDLRYYGGFISPDNEKIEHWGYAADNFPELKTRFEAMVIKIIEYEGWRAQNNTWLNSGIDKESIGCVFGILPSEFRSRIESGQYDQELNNSVRGGIYEVPLWYVTKAWDVLLKGDLCNNAWRIEYDPECDDPVERTLEVAISQNDEIKRIWKELIGIDVDAQDINFEQFDMHLPPNVTCEEDFYNYFQDVPNGIEEWILDGINTPSNYVNFEYVSSLMEFTAYTLKERKERNERKDRY